MNREHMRELTAIPNLFSYLRIVLIPEYVWLYLLGERRAALAVLLISAASDFLDGRAARGLDMVTSVGRIVDPVADKLTQLAVILCLAVEYYPVQYLLIIIAAKEIGAAVAGWVLLRGGGKPFSAKWYGKLSTAVLYAYSAVLLCGFASSTAVIWLTVICSGAVILSFALYTAEFFRRIS